MTESDTKILATPAVANTPRLSPGPNLKVEIVERPASPEINCAICLEELRNKSYTNTCLHQFCFHCLLEWSKVKPECPLCKQVFSRIFHNIRSNEDYDEHILEPPLPPPPPLDPHIFINVAFQRHRFRYRSTVGGSMMWTIQGLEPILSERRHWSSTASNNYPIDYTVQPPTNARNRQGATTTRAVARCHRLDSSAFRRNVYRQGLWVRPGTSLRFRECSPEFYRLNPAQTHRLVPWLTRELNVLLEMPYDTHTVCQDILNLITAHHINSSVFHRAMTYYLGSTAEHFIHEFYHFAISPHEMNAYDTLVQYGQAGREFSSESDSDVEMLNLPEPLVSLDLTAAPGPSGLQPPPLTSSPEQPTTNTSSNIIFIELSDDEEPRANEEADSDVEIIGQLPPRHLRTPEVITIESDSDVISETGRERPAELHQEITSQQRNLGSPVDEDVEEERERKPNTSAEDYSTYTTFQTAPCECPLYDNCPYSKEVNKMGQCTRRSYKRNITSASSSSPSTSSSHYTDIEIDVEASSSSRSASSRRGHKRSRTECKKRKLSRSDKRSSKKKRSSSSSTSSSSSASSSSSSSKTSCTQNTATTNNFYSSDSLHSQSSHQKCSNDSLVTTGDGESSAANTSVTNTSITTDEESDDINKSASQRIKSVVLKVDKNGTTHYKKSTRYIRKRGRIISESGSEA